MSATTTMTTSSRDVAEAAAAARPSLLKVDPPVPASQVRKPRALKLKATKGPGQGGAGGPQGKKEGEGRKTIPALDDILNAILPPEAVMDPSGDEPLLKCVSSVPATRLDLMHLQDDLDERLLDRQAREAGICPVRAELYRQAFDELIRQATLECPERGLMLLRIRDDLRATQSAHRMLYRSAVAFGTRKLLTASDGIPELKAQVSSLEAERVGLETEVLELQARMERIEADAVARRVAEEKRRAQELNFLKKTVNQLTTQMKTETDRANTKK